MMNKYRGAPALLATAFAISASIAAAPAAQAGSSGKVTTTPTKTTVTANTTVATAYYLSPTGSDTNNGLSASAPFKTFEKAQAAMRASTIKTTYLLGGTYYRAAPLILKSPDNGESWLGYPGQTPVIDGQNVAAEAFYFSATNLTFRWLTIQNFVNAGIFAQYSTGILIDSNTIRNIHSTGWNQAGILTMNSFVNGKITHNSVQNTQADGILSVTGTSDKITNLLIDSNVVSNTCTVVSDCAAIHANDRGHSSTGMVISNNVVSNYGPASRETIGIYLDDLLSYTTVQNNVVYGVGNYPLLVHGGDHNTIKNNIFDITQTYMLALYQYIAPYSMADNVFTCNVTYSAGPNPIALWHTSGAVTPPIDTKNVYWKTSGTLPNIGMVVDSAPLTANPNFVNPTAGNYAIQSSVPTSYCGFAPINTSQVGPLPNT
jgi:hypothetical protein